MGRVNCTGLQKLDDAAAEQLRWGQGSRILRRRLPTDLVSASPAGCCAQRCYTEPRGRTGGGNEDWIWMLDKLRSGEWRAHGGMARKRTGARREPKIFTIGSLSSRRKYSSGWLRFWNYGVIRHWDRPLLEPYFSFTSKTKIFGMYFGYS